MTAVRQNLRICGNILSTDSFNYFVFRCAACKNSFEEVLSFIQHIQQWHGKKDNEIEIFEKELKEEEIVFPAEYLDEEQDDNKTNEVDFLRSEDEANTTDDTDEDWKPEDVEILSELKVESIEEVLLNEKKWTDYDNDNDAENEEKKNDTIEATFKTKKSAKKPKTFYFNLVNTVYKEISIEFMKLLEDKPCLWNTAVKYRKKEERLTARREIKFKLREKGFIISEKTFAKTISHILQEYKVAEKQAKQNYNELNDSSMLILNNCEFLNSRVKKETISKSNTATGEDKTKKFKSKGTKRRANSLKESSSVIDEVKTEVRDFSEAERSDSDSDISEYSNDSDDSSKSTTGLEVVPSKLVKNDLASYQRIRFQLLGNKIAGDYIDLLREQPSVWNGTHPDYYKKGKRRSIIEAWIPHFQQQYNITFNYNDLNENWQNLRRYYKANRELVPGKRLSRGSLALRKRLSFLSERKIRQRVKCEHCDSLAVGERSYLNHLYLKHGIGECQFKCADCDGREFRNASEFNLHMKQSHSSGDTEYRCQYCDRKFPQRHNMVIHEQLHTGVIMNFVCATCGQSFRRKANLEAHEVRIHLRQRNFTCTMCPKAFYTKGLLQDHMNVHLNIRRHKCPTCDKGFHSAHALMRHKQVHTGSKKAKYPKNGPPFLYPKQNQEDATDMTAASGSDEVAVVAHLKEESTMHYGY